MSHCELFLSEHSVGVDCGDRGHQAALANRAKGAPSWGQIVRGHDEGGERDFLDGLPIHCGDVVELQGIEYRSDEYGEYTLKLSTGAPVRYELTTTANGQVVVLYGSVAGHEFTSPGEQWMRFRWPERRS